MARPFRGVARRGISCPALLVAVACATVSAHAQGTTDAYLALRGTAQGAIKGMSTAAAYRDDIVAMSLSTSEPYGAATPVLHVVTDAAIAPQIMHALETDEVLVAPTISFAKRGSNTTLQQFYQIKALRGYITAATISADVNHVPTVAFDLLLSGGVASTNEVGAPTTAPPPSVAGNVPAARGVVLTGEFTGQTMSDFPSSPNVPSRKGIFLDSVAITAVTPVSNGMTSGNALARPLVITRPANQDAMQFDYAIAHQEQFSDIVLHVYVPQLNGQLAEVLWMETRGACIVEGSTSCVGRSTGAGAAKPGGSTGLSATGGSTRSTTQPPIGIRRVAGDRSATLQLIVTMLTVENPVTHTTETHTFATATN